jgi:hypothetical protein
MAETLALKPKIQKQADTLLAEREKPSRPALVSQALILCPLPYRKPKDTILERVTRIPGGQHHGVLCSHTQGCIPALRE